MMQPDDSEEPVPGEELDLTNGHLSNEGLAGVDLPSSLTVILRCEVGKTLPSKTCLSDLSDWQQVVQLL